MESLSIAYEMLRELKSNSKRWFIIAVVELVIIISMAIGFLIYQCQYDYATTTEEYTQETSDIDFSDVTQTIN